MILPKILSFADVPDDIQLVTYASGSRLFTNYKHERLTEIWFLLAYADFSPKPADILSFQKWAVLPISPHQRQYSKSWPSNSYWLHWKRSSSRTYWYQILFKERCKTSKRKLPDELYEDSDAHMWFNVNITKGKGLRMKIEIWILEFSRLGTLNLTRMAHFKANTTVLLVSLLRVFEKFFTTKR